MNVIIQHIFGKKELKFFSNVRNFRNNVCNIKIVFVSAKMSK